MHTLKRMRVYVVENLQPNIVIDLARKTMHQPMCENAVAPTRCLPKNVEAKTPISQHKVSQETKLTNGVTVYSNPAKAKAFEKVVMRYFHP